MKFLQALKSYFLTFLTSKIQFRNLIEKVILKIQILSSNSKLKFKLEFKFEIQIQNANSKFVFKIKILNLQVKIIIEILYSNS